MARGSLGGWVERGSVSHDMLVHRARIRPWIMLASLAVGGPACGRGATERATADGKATAAAEASTGACDAAHAKALEQELVAQCDVYDVVLALDVPAAPWKPAPSAAPTEALPLEVSPAGVVVFTGEPVPMADLAAHLAEGIEKNTALAEALGKPPTSAWVLTLASATPRAEVATVMKVLADAGLREGYLRLGAEATAPLPQPRDPKQLAELAARVAHADVSEKAVRLAREAEAAMPPCPALEQGFSNAATNDPEDRCRVLARDLSAGLVHCGCPKEDVVMTLVYALMVGLEPPKQVGAAVPVTLDPAAPARTGATWAEVVAGLDQGALAKLWVSPS